MPLWLFILGGGFILTGAAVGAWMLRSTEEAEKRAVRKSVRPILDGLSVREWFDYNPQTGELSWKKLPKCSSTPLTKLQCKAGKPIVSGKNGSGYLRVMLGQRSYRAHRVAFLWMTGQWPEGVIDHINGDAGDNRWCNLRTATVAQNISNQQNRRLKNSHGLKGVTQYFKTDRWVAQINHKGKHIVIGVFDTKEAAHEAYCATARELHGEFASFTYKP